MFLFLCLIALYFVSGSPLTTRALGITYTGIAQPPFSDLLGPGTLPLLTLPYATYQAKSYDADNDIYIFANIRFAAPPVGNLRWAPPAEPLTESGIQNGSIGGTCFQSASLEVLIPFKCD